MLMIPLSMVRNQVILQIGKLFNIWWRKKFCFHGFGEFNSNIYLKHGACFGWAVFSLSRNTLLLNSFFTLIRYLHPETCENKVPWKKNLRTWYSTRNNLFNNNTPPQDTWKTSLSPGLTFNTRMQLNMTVLIWISL